MKSSLKHLDKWQIQAGLDGGLWAIPAGVAGNLTLVVIASWGAGWDHVSASLPRRCPTWDEMCQIKSMFFEPEEPVMQLHPPRSRYVNNHPYCLHLWRPQHEIIPLPPEILVGIKNLEIKS